MSYGLVATKLGMSQKFTEAGEHIPVTLLRVDDHFVIDKKESKLLLGTHEVKETRIAKPQRGLFQKNNIACCKVMKEFQADNVDQYTVGQTIDLTVFAEIQFIDATSYSKGRGFAGVIKRHNFSQLRASHGTSACHRSHGSTGQRQDPGRVFKGKKMAGRYGNTKVTVQNLRIISLDPESKILAVKGCVPGPNQGLVILRKAIKKVIQ